MGSHRNMIICGAFILIICLSFMTGCVKRSDSSKMVETVVISTTELKSIDKSSIVSLTDDSPGSILLIPKVKETTLSEVISWLQQAKEYKGKIPQSQISGMFKANIGPSKLYIATSDKHEITIQPAFYLVSNDDNGYEVRYVTDVLKLNNDKQEMYVQSSELFNWLKNDKWKTEFEIKQ